MLRRERTKHTLRNLLNTKSSKPTKGKSRSDLPNNCYRSENPNTRRVERKSDGADNDGSSQACWMLKLPHHLLDEGEKDLAVHTGTKRFVYYERMAYRLPCSLHQGEKRKVYEHSLESLKIHRKASVKYPMLFAFKKCLVFLLKVCQNLLCFHQRYVIIVPLLNRNATMTYFASEGGTYFGKKSQAYSNENGDH